MRPLFRHVVLVLLALWLAACAEPPPALAPLSSDATLLAFGDSLTYGSGAPQEASYPAVLAQMTGRTVINAGVPGELSRNGAQRLPDLLDEHRPDLLLLCHGGNDLLRRFPTEETVANLRRMIEAARSRGIQVVLISVPQPTLLRRRSADFYAELAAEYGVPVEDESLARIESDDDLKADPIHPNAAGYRRLAEAVQRLLQASGAI